MKPLTYRFSRRFFAYQCRFLLFLWQDYSPVYVPLHVFPKVETYRGYGSNGLPNVRNFIIRWNSCELLAQIWRLTPAETPSVYPLNPRSRKENHPR